MLEAANIGLLVVLEDLTSDESGTAFIELCRALVTFSKRLKQAKGMVHKIQSIVQQSGIVLPHEAALILES